MSDAPHYDASCSHLVVGMYTNIQHLSYKVFAKILTVFNRRLIFGFNSTSFILQTYIYVPLETPFLSILLSLFRKDIYLLDYISLSRISKCGDGGKN